MSRLYNLERLYARFTGEPRCRRFLNVEQKENLMDWLVEQGRQARQSGDTVNACPYGVTELVGRTAWLAGYRDTARGLQ